MKLTSIRFHSSTETNHVVGVPTRFCPDRASRRASLFCALLLTLAAPSVHAAAVTEAWVQRYNGPANNQDRAQAVAVDNSGNVVVTGYSVEVGSGGFDFSVAIYTAKYAAADGALLWEKRDLGLANRSSEAKALAVDASGNVVVAGYSHNGHNYDFYTAKYAAADGALLWAQRYNGPGGDDDFASAVAVDGNGNVVVTGQSRNIRGLPNFYTAKYAAADGAVLWEKRTTGIVDWATAIAVDGSGNVVVTGQSDNGSSSLDFYTAKYASADGALLWEQRYSGPGYDFDYAKAVALDRSGNVLVTGLSYGTNRNPDYYTAKYAAEDGFLLWEKRYNGPANGVDIPTAVAVDGSGNVVVTGGSGMYEDFGNFMGDNYTAKYASADGTLLWENHFPGPLNGLDPDSAAKVDERGNVVVAGTSYNGSNDDYYTAKYAAADGALLWEKRYNGPANQNDIVSGSHSLALGPNGMVAVTGSSSDDYATVVYRENQLPVIACPVNRVMDFTSSAGAVVNFTITATDDSGVPPAVTCAPSSGSVFPVGRTTVACTATDGDGLSGACSFTVTVRGARDVHQNVLAELFVLRATVRDHEDLRKLNDVVAHLNQSLAADLWLDQTHLQRERGERVFEEDKEAVKKLCELIKSRNSGLADAVLQKLVARIFQADRLLAVIAIDDASRTGVPPKKLEQARKFLAKGDAELGDENCANGLEDYRNAWNHATQP